MKPLLEMEFKTFAFETIPALKEVQCALKVLNQTENDVSAWISVTCKVTFSSSSFYI
jgi:S-methylmethionine-dependent homocysteine/selenocysteine methylase